MTAISLLKRKTPYIQSYLPPTGIWIEQFRVPLIRHPTYNFSRSKLILGIYFNGVNVTTSRRSDDGTYRSTSKKLNDKYICYPRSFDYNYELTTARSNGMQEAILTMILTDPMPQDIGIYEVVFKINKSQVGLDCCPDHASFLLDSEGMHLQYYVVGLATVELKEPGILIYYCTVTMSSETFAVQKQLKVIEPKVIEPQGFFFFFHLWESD